MRFQLSTLRLLAPVGLTGLIIANVTTTTAAQDSGATPRSVVVEEIQDGFVVKPSFKFTEVDDELGALTGLSIGQITDGRLFLGAGINWLVSGSNRTDLAYGGGIIEWFSDPDARVNVSVGSLVGLGAATLDTGEFRRRGILWRQVFKPPVWKARLRSLPRGVRREIPGRVLRVRTPGQHRVQRNRLVSGRIRRRLPSHRSRRRFRGPPAGLHRTDRTSFRSAVGWNRMVSLQVIENNVGGRECGG